MTSLAQDKVLSQNGYGGRIKACIGIYMYLSVYLGIYMYLCIYMYLSVHLSMHRCIYLSNINLWI